MHRIDRARLTIIFILFVSMAIAATTVATLRIDATPIKPSPLNPTRIYRITPPYGFSPGTVRSRLSKSERDIVRILQRIANDHNRDGADPNPLIRWRIEDTATRSRTLRLGVAALRAAHQFVEFGSPGDTEPVTIIVGRTQRFIKDNIVALGCPLNFHSSNGQYLMGGTICARRVIVINLTGYLFLTSTNQGITTSMERRREPPLRSIRYLEVDRNLGALAHEWTHVARWRLSDRFVPADEPAWFREGLAEIVAGLGRVRASNGRMSYLEFHVIRLRKFSDWRRNCVAPLRSYRRTSATFGGCEYVRGTAALELLLARRGGMEKIRELLTDIAVTGDFFASFRSVYGISVARFERSADIYASHIRSAARRGP